MKTLNPQVTLAARALSRCSRDIVEHFNEELIIKLAKFQTDFEVARSQLREADNETRHAIIQHIGKVL